MQGIFVQLPSVARSRNLAQDFEALHDVPYIIGAIDGSHILIFAHVIAEEDYYCRISFHSVLLQCIVDTKCVFWNYRFGWAWNMHDWTLFQLTKVQRDCIESKFLLYKLIGDCANLVQPWIYNPFKGCAECLEGFIQSSDCMCVKRVFRILKSKWRIVMKRIDIPLRHMNNMCIIGNDKFDMKWIE